METETEGSLSHYLSMADKDLQEDRLDQCVENLQQAATLSPLNSNLHALIARVELKRSALTQHDHSIARAISLNPRAAHLYIRAALACPPLMTDPSDISKIRARILSRLEKLIAGAGNLELDDVCENVPTLSFYTVYHGENDLEIYSALFQLLERLDPALTYQADHVGRSIDGPIRLGILSSNMRRHTIGRLFGPMLSRLDPNRFDVVFIFADEHFDEESLEYASRSGHIVIPRKLRPARAAIADLELDLLLYPDIGMDSFMSYMAMSRLATAQCTTWGHPVTTGIGNMDAFLSIDALESDRENPPYSETLLCQSIPNLYYRRPVPEEGVTKASLGLPEDKRLYGFPQTLFKLHPDFDEVLIDILRRDPEGALLMSNATTPYWRRKVVDRLEGKFPGFSERIHWLPNIPREQYVGMLALMDVMLDPFPFGGGNTTLEALSVGTPVVTCPPRFARGRLAYAFMKRMGWEKTVVANAEEYVDLALRLANDVDFNKQCRSEILSHCGILFECDEAVRQFEDQLEAAYQVGKSKF
jgi:protein O-GlcNAc transferase